MSVSFASSAAAEIRIAITEKRQRTATSADRQNVARMMTAAPARMHAVTRAGAAPQSAARTPAARLKGGPCSTGCLVETVFDFLRAGQARPAAAKAAPAARVATTCVTTVLTTQEAVLAVIDAARVVRTASVLATPVAKGCRTINVPVWQKPLTIRCRGTMQYRVHPKMSAPFRPLHSPFRNRRRRAAGPFMAEFHTGSRPVVTSQVHSDDRARSSNHLCGPSSVTIGQLTTIRSTCRTRRLETSMSNSRHHFRS